MAVNDSFNNLINDITQQVLQQVQAQVQGAITDAVNQQINNLISGDDIRAIVLSRVNENLYNYTPNLSQFESGLQNASNQIINNLNASAESKINGLINDKISSFDIDATISNYVSSRLESLSDKFPFKDRSIAGSAIDAEGLEITGDNITGGVIKNFGSTGIDDQSSSCQITILDVGAVFENTVYAGKLEVKGGATIEGDLTILGEITDNPGYQKLVADTGTSVLASIGPDLLDEHQNRVFERIRDEGMDLSRVTFNGKVIVDGNKLTSAILESQLQSLGVVRDLQTQGENLLSDTLYVSAKRVGVNTMDPNTALSVWDEEIEIGLGKQSQGIARIGIVRDHKLIIGTNKKDNITLNPDGVTEIPQLRLGNMLMSTSPTPPHYDAPRGTIVFNEQPNLGGPLGWVSLGDAKWANFGIID
jgi:hypothetical protein